MTAQVAISLEIVAGTSVVGSPGGTSVSTSITLLESVYNSDSDMDNDKLEQLPLDDQSSLLTGISKDFTMKSSDDTLQSRSFFDSSFISVTPITNSKTGIPIIKKNI